MIREVYERFQQNKKDYNNAESGVSEITKLHKRNSDVNRNMKIMLKIHIERSGEYYLHTNGRRVSQTKYSNTVEIRNIMLFIRR